MENTIGWGEIYKYTWWGDFAYNTRSILIPGIPAGFTDVSFATYKTRAIADAGTFEAEQCAINTYNRIISRL